MRTARNLIKKGKIWYFRTQAGGRDRLISTHETDRAAAIAAAAEIRSVFERERASRRFASAFLEVVKGMASEQLTREHASTRLADLERMAAAEVLPAVSAMIPAPPFTASELWKRFLASSPRLKSSTLNTKTQRFDVFARWSGKKDLRRFDRAEALRFLDSLGTEKAQTWRNYISDLASVWRAAPELPSPWTADLRRVAAQKKAPVEHKAFLSLQEMRRIKDYIEAEMASAENEKSRRKWQFWHFFMILSYHMFCRLTDVVHASAFSVRADGFFDFSPRKTENRTGGRKVAAEISPQLAAELETLTPGEQGLYFPDYAARYDAGPSGRKIIDREFTAILKAAGIFRPGLGCHSMRHGGITLAIDAENAPEDVAAVAGHDSTALTTGTYYHGKRKTRLTLPDL